MPAVNYAAVAVAAIAGWLTGAGWYGVFGNRWMAALGWTEADLLGHDGKRHLPMGPLVLALIANLVMALMLAGIVGHIVPRPTIIAGIASGALVWFGFVVTTQAVNNAFAKRSLALTLIDGGHWLAVLVVQGVVLGLFG
jgi:Protein of unknown function (DUF1761)